MRHRRCSSASVPLLSPRETKGAWAAATAFNAATASRVPAICAGSERGPTTMKSFQAICLRSMPSPIATNFCSASGSCTRTRSASLRAAVASACPVPCARTWTVMPVDLVKVGRIFASRPEFSTEVVEARMIDTGEVCETAIATCASRATTAVAKNCCSFIVSPKDKGAGAHGDTNADQEETKAQRQPKIALACLQYDRRCHRAGVPGDVAADDQNRADLGDRAAEAGQHRRRDRPPRDGEEHPN